MRVFVILPAAGIGTRMAAAGASAPKQFLELGGQPILIHSLKAFAGVAAVTEILVAVRPQEMERVHQQVAAAGLGGRVRVVEGRYMAI